MHNLHTTRVARGGKVKSIHSTQNSDWYLKKKHEECSRVALNNRTIETIDGQFEACSQLHAGTQLVNICLLKMPLSCSTACYVSTLEFFYFLCWSVNLSIFLTDKRIGSSLLYKYF